MGEIVWGADPEKPRRGYLRCLRHHNERGEGGELARIEKSFLVLVGLLNP